ncbi:hypothetical protein ACLOJK_033882 [Asimina triloba]
MGVDSMNRQCDRGSTDTEIRRFKNRVRQQRYRARKREEKIKRIVDANRADRITLLQPNAPHPPLGPSILCMASMADVVTAQKTDAVKRNEGNGICSAEAQRFAIFSSGGAGNYHKDAESTQAVCGRSILQTYCSSHPIQRGNQSEFPAPKIFQPIYKMEGGGYNSNPGDELMTRRLKNRERQRRYRARKRLEADIVRNAQHPNPPLHHQIQQHPRGFIRARRDWKKDARNAHAHKFPHLFPLDLRVSSALSSGSEGQGGGGGHVKQGIRMPLEMNICDSEERPQTQRRRDWKAAARSKAG